MVTAYADQQADRYWQALRAFSGRRGTNVCCRDFLRRERTSPGEYRSRVSPFLKELCRQAPDVVPAEALRRLGRPGYDFDTLMTCLEDYDLVREKEGWRMRSRVIADSWRLGEPWPTVGQLMTRHLSYYSGQG